MKLVCAPQPFDFNKYSSDLNIQLYSIADDKSFGYSGHSVADYIRRKKLNPQPKSWDFLSIALSCVCADMAGHRRKSPDGWTRQFDLTIAVTDPDFWNGIAELIKETLDFLTTDIWTFNFVEGGYYPTPSRPGKQIDADCITLLSGGMDSLIGAIDIVSDKNTPVTVSQVVRGDRSKQVQFPKLLGASLPSIVLSHKSKVPSGETPASQRSRSIVFLAYAALIASSVKTYDENHSLKFFVSENGFISLNTPLTPMRVGSLSTRTTHPSYLTRVQKIFDSAGININIENKYSFKTKGEMLKECADQDLIKKLAHQSTSCGRYLTFNYTHCGRCVPCLVRRAAFHKWGHIDETQYIYEDLGRKGSEYSGFDDVRAVAMAALEMGDVGADRWLGANLASASISDAKPYVELVERGIGELQAFLDHMGVK